MVAPDIAGFRAAQRRLRQVLGVDATFHIPVAATWAPGEAVDPETGRPYDPFATPASGGGFSDATVRVSFVSRPLGATRSAHGEYAETPIGDVDTEVVALIVDADDYDTVKNATRVTVNGHLWQIETVRHDELAGDTRWIFFLEDA